MLFQGLISAGKVATTLSAPTEFFRGFGTTGGAVCIVADTAQARVYVNGIAIETSSGKVIAGTTFAQYGPGGVPLTATGGIVVDSAGGITLYNAGVPYAGTGAFGVTTGLSAPADQFATSATTVTGTSHVVTMPSGIVSGDFLAVYVVFDDGGASTLTWPAGWIVPNNHADYIFTSGGQSFGVSMRVRKADGTEGASITLTTSTNKTMMARAMKFESVSMMYTNAPSWSQGTDGDCPNLIPMTSGSEAFRWIALLLIDGATVASGYPAGFTDNQYAASTALTLCGIAHAMVNDTVASKNPGAFTVAASQAMRETNALAPLTAFPFVAANIDSSNATSSVSQTVTLPNKGQAVGSLLLAWVSVENASTHTWPAGWNEIADANNTTVGLSVAYRIADNTEAASITVTASIAGRGSAQCVRIENWHGTTPPEISTVATGSSVSPDSNSLTPSWGSNNTLWYTIMSRAGTSAPSAYPASYPYTNSGAQSGIGGVYQAGANRRVAAASEDPGAFTISTSDWIAFTVAVRPA